ncbi:MAG TPA: excisionase family DNA-binding protein [Candidatus Dormibacteraeota bacterium]|nr:excisionase family DNA-binding protein [Candidatus Dormibacteraeota bacterium]
MSRKPTNLSSLFSGEAEGPGTSLDLVPGLRPSASAPPQVEPLLVRPVEAARLLGIGRSKLFEMLARNELPVVRLGRCVRIPRRELALWVDQSLDAEATARNAFLGAGQTPSSILARESVRQTG